MTKRVIIGTRGSDIGMWIAPPGKSAESTVFEELLIDTTRTNMEPVIRGVINPAVLTYSTTFSSVPPLFNVSGIWIWGQGTAVYVLDIDHNLGYIPVCNLSIQSDYCGMPFPQFRIDSTRIRLWVQYGWTGTYNYPVLPPPKYGYGSTSFNLRATYVLYRQSMP